MMVIVINANVLDFIPARTVQFALPMLVDQMEPLMLLVHHVFVTLISLEPNVTSVCLIYAPSVPQWIKQNVIAVFVIYMLQVLSVTHVILKIAPMAQ
jgi:hypothetical protein